MKKLFLILAVVVALSSVAFADKSRFYEGGKVIDTMYVDSEDGLRARNFPSLKSARLCALPHRLPVKVVAVGKEETIDGMTAPWVEILLQRYEWQGEEPEYGWVFGGYLSEKQPKFIEPKNAGELSDYLTRLLFLIDMEEYPNSMYAVRMLPDGSYEGGALSGARPTEGTWKAQTHNSFLLCKVYDNGFDSNEKITVTVRIEEPYTYFAFIGDKFKRIFPSEHASLTFDDDNMKSPMLYEKNYKNQTYLQYLADCEKVDSERISLSIIAGVSAKGTKYEKQYHDYWNPIMAEHQKKADEMK